MVTSAQRVLLPSQDTAHNTYRPAWFQKDAEFDGEIRARFGQAVESALAGDAGAHEETIKGFT